LSLEWETVELNDIVSLVIDYRGKTPKKLGSDWSEEGIMALSAKNIKTGKIIREDTIRFVDTDLYHKWMKEEVRRNDILITSEAPFGEVYFWNSDEKIVLSQRLFAVRCDEKKVVPKFIYFYMTSEMFQWELTSRATGTTVKGLRQPELLKCNIHLPNYETQFKIANILSFLEDKINVLNKINHNLEQLAKSIYKHHFIDMKPYMLGGYIRESPLGIIPKDWSVQLIGEFVDDMKNGGTPRRGESAYWENGTIPWLKTGEINNNIILKSEEHITELGLKNSSAKLLPKNSIIMALYGKGTAARIGLLKIEATTNQACCAMICNDLNKTLFLYLFLLFNQKEIENLASGSVQQNLSKDLIANLNLIVPPIEIIENLPFKEIFDTIANNYFEIEYLTNLRDTLLPKLMSGEVDVSKINCDLD